MRSPRTAGGAAGWAVSALLFVKVARGHPLCLSFEQPFPGRESGDMSPLCTELVDNADGTCCSVDREWELWQEVQDQYTYAALPVTAECDRLHRQVKCAECHPWVLHLTESVFATTGQQEMMLKKGFCEDYVAACGASLALPADYCKVHTQKKDALYSYPFTSDTERYKDVPITFESAFPNVKEGLPLSMVGLYMMPGSAAAAGTWWILDLFGIIYSVPKDPAKALKLDVVVDISERVLMGGERGLLSMTFAPDFEESGDFYVMYFDYEWRTVISRLTLSPGDPVTTALSETVLLTIPQPTANHNGGSLLFHPDDVASNGATCAEEGCDLYITTGDGGGGYDLLLMSQNLNSHLGKVLRLRVALSSLQIQNVAILGEGDPAPLYSIPPDNPFVDSTGFDGTPLPEIWAWGLRNPWRCSFDKETGDLWVADVGQQAVEEIDIVRGGLNYGWNDHEGDRCTVDIPVAGNCQADYEPPIYQYCQASFIDTAAMFGEEEAMKKVCANSIEDGIEGRSITGGLVYHGKKYADALGGKYIFADYESHMMAYLSYNEEKEEWRATSLYTIEDGIPQIVHIAEDEDGELYVIPYNRGEVYVFECGPACDDNATTVDTVDTVKGDELPVEPEDGARAAAKQFAEGMRQASKSKESKILKKLFGNR